MLLPNGYMKYYSKKNRISFVAAARQGAIQGNESTLESGALTPQISQDARSPRVHYAKTVEEKRVPGESFHSGSSACFTARICLYPSSP